MRLGFKKTQCFRFQGINKKRKVALERQNSESWDSVRSLYLDIQHKAVEFLEMKVQQATSSTGPQVPRVEQDTQEDDAQSSSVAEKSEQGDEIEEDEEKS